MTYPIPDPELSSADQRRKDRELERWRQRAAWFSANGMVALRRGSRRIQRPKPTEKSMRCKCGTFTRVPVDATEFTCWRCGECSSLVKGPTT